MNEGYAKSAMPSRQDMNQTVRPGHEGLINQEIGSITNALDNLDGVMGDLIGRVQPILSPDTPSTTDKSVSAASMSPLHDALVTINNKIYRLRRLLENTVERITL